MFINATGYYIPEERVPNDYFTPINGMTNQWIYQRTGIKTRSKASNTETMNFMCFKAVQAVQTELPYSIQEIDLIIFASYTPSDTIGTAAHYIQREFNINNAKVFHISSACSSALNAMEIIQSFFKSGIATKALLVCADRNSTYSDEANTVSGHLWGDAAVCMCFSKTRQTANNPQVIDITTEGLGHIGYGPKGVYLDLTESKLHMPYGKDVFIQACTYIAKNTINILEKNGYFLEELSYFIGHQANMRIIKNVATQLDISEDKILSNIEELGNTGCASALLVFAQNIHLFNAKDLICISVFGGGYSTGACLIEMP